MGFLANAPFLPMIVLNNFKISSQSHQPKWNNGVRQNVDNYKTTVPDTHSLNPSIHSLYSFYPKIHSSFNPIFFYFTAQLIPLPTFHSHISASDQHRCLPPLVGLDRLHPNSSNNPHPSHKAVRRSIPSVHPSIYSPWRRCPLSPLNHLSGLESMMNWLKGILGVQNGRKMHCICAFKWKKEWGRLVFLPLIVCRFLIDRLKTPHQGLVLDPRSPLWHCLCGKIGWMTHYY